MNDFTKKMLELGAELDKAQTGTEITMIVADAEVLYNNHFKEMDQKINLLIEASERALNLGEVHFETNHFAKGVKRELILAIENAKKEN